MRTAFIEELTRQARIRPEIFLTVGDLGYSVVEPFAEEFPDRFLNAGVAEQNMTGVAAGLASEGYHVFTYSIANFSTLRCLEQIRNDVCYHRYPVTVVSVGAGLAYGNLGYSHHAVQDIAIMRTLPGISILSPSDPGETRESVQWLTSNPSPSYLRLGKAGEASLHNIRGIAEGPLLIRKGDAESALAATGSVLQVALEASDITAMTGPRPSVYSCPVLKPVNTSFFASLLQHQRIVVVEEHIFEGGLASILRENLPPGIEVHRIGLDGATDDQVGSQDSLRRLNGITAEDLNRQLQTLASTRNPL